jgi:hypothetical protein
LARVGEAMRRFIWSSIENRLRTATTKEARFGRGCEQRANEC